MAEEFPEIDENAQTGFLSGSAQDPDCDGSRKIARDTLRELLVCAEAYDRATGASFDSERWFSGQSESLLYWAENRGRVLSASEFERLIEGFKVIPGGIEHQVFYLKKKGLMIKMTKTPPQYGHTHYLTDYVRNILRCNRVFGDDIRIEGVVQLGRAGLSSLVISQPYIRGMVPTEKELEDWFTGQGYKMVSKYRWRHPNGRVVSDAHTKNLILTPGGEIVPIDVHIEKAAPGDDDDESPRNLPK